MSITLNTKELLNSLKNAKNFDDRKTSILINLVSDAHHLNISYDAFHTEKKSSVTIFNKLSIYTLEDNTINTHCQLAKLLPIISKIKTKTLSLDFEDGLLLVMFGTVNMKIDTSKHDNIDQVQLPENYIKINGRLLKEALASVKDSISKDHGMDALNYTAISYENETLSFIGLNGHVCTWKDILNLDAHMQHDFKDALLSLENLISLYKYLDDKQEYKLYFTEKNLIVIHDSSVVCFTLGRYTYPDTKRFLNIERSGNFTEIKINKGDFMTDLAMINDVNEKATNNFFIEKDTLKIRSENNEFIKSLECDVEGNLDHSIKFSVKQMEAILKQFINDEIILKIHGIDLPCLAYDEQDKTYTALIMPMRQESKYTEN